MTPIQALAVIYSMSGQEEEISPAEALLDLADVLAARYGEMADADWESLATVGVVLWRIGFKEAESREDAAALIAKVKRQT